MRRYANRRDANEPEIVKALKAIGCSVMRLDAVDLVAGRGGVTMLLEVKDGAKSKSRRKLTDAQRELRDTWRGHWVVVDTVDAAIAEIERHTMRHNIGRGRMV